MRRLFWQDIDPVVQRTVLILVSLGILLIGLGFIADAAGFWKDASFTPNIFSSLASACFGIPLALVVLRYLIDQQEERSARRRAQRLAIATVQRMTVLGALLVGDRDKLNDAHDHIAECFFWMRGAKIVREGFSQARPAAALWPGTRANKQRRYLAEKSEEWKPRCQYASDLFYRDVIDHFDRHRACQELESCWRYLDESVRPKYQECGLHWLEPETMYNARNLSWDPFDDAAMASSGWVGKGREAYLKLFYVTKVEAPEVTCDRLFDLIDTLWVRSCRLLKLQEVLDELRDQLCRDTPV